MSAGAVRANTESRLRALEIGLLVMAGLALIPIILSGRLPNYIPGEGAERPTAGAGVARRRKKA